MTRNEIIEKVKVKLEEVSPFDEPSSFIAAGGDSDYDKVKPVISYIDGSLDEACAYCLKTLPVQVLSNETSKCSTAEIEIDYKGVGHVSRARDRYNKSVLLGVPTLRIVRVCLPEIWGRDCLTITDSSSPLYVLQQNAYTRGNTAKPVAAYSAENKELELYSFPASYRPSTAGTTQKYAGKSDIYLIDTRKDVTSIVMTDVIEFIVLECAILVYNILGNTNQVKVLQDEYQQLLAPYIL